MDVSDYQEGVNFMDVQAFVGEEEVIKMNAELAERRDFTVVDIENLPENVRAELIDGQIFYFAAPMVIHQEILVEISNRLYNHIKSKDGMCKMIVAPVKVCLIEDGKNYLEPDIIVVCDKEKIKEDGCHGAPDLVIEIASKSTKNRDYGIKMLKYRTAGVKEYWIVDPMRETIMVYWFDDEEQNCLYGFQEEVKFHLFPELAVKLKDE